MGTSLQKTFIIWIDKYVNDDGNPEFQSQVKKYENIKFNGFTDLQKGISYIKENVKFHKTIIIVSGRLFPDFCKEFKDELLEMCVIPKIIIFTGNVDKFKSYNKDNEFVNDPFYNIGGVVDSFEDLKKFVENSLNIYNPKFEGENKNRYPEEPLKFQIISDKKDLILPMFYMEKLNHFSEEEMKQSVEKLFEENKDNEEIEFLFSQLVEAGNIPANIFAKFWMRAYSTHTKFVENMNKDLLNKSYKDFLPIIQKLYETINRKQFLPETKPLYKGIYIEDYIWKPIYDSYKEKEKNIQNNMPPAILYGTSFFSFYNEKSALNKFKELNIARFKNVFLQLVLETSREYHLRAAPNNIFINEEMSYFKESDEIVFLPFSCLGVKNIEKINDNLYNITLCYLEDYNQRKDKKDNLFSDFLNIKFEEIPESDVSKLILNSGIINEGLIEMPTWFENQSSLDDIKTIKDKFLFNQVKNICKEEIYKKNYNYADDLRKNISDILKNRYSGNWWVIVNNEQLNNYGNVKDDSVMIFKYCTSSINFYIHVAKLSTE